MAEKQGMLLSWACMAGFSFPEAERQPSGACVLARRLEGFVRRLDPERQQCVNDSVGISVVSEGISHSEGSQLLAATANADHGDAERSAHKNVPRCVAKVGDRREIKPGARGR